VVEGGSDNSQFVVIISIAMAVLLVIVSAVGCRFLIMKSKRDLTHAQKKATRKDIDIKVQKIDTVNEKELAEMKDTNKISGGYQDVIMESCVSKRVEMEEYEAQYDPNNDFAIFGIGD